MAEDAHEHGVCRGGVLQQTQLDDIGVCTDALPVRRAIPWLFVVSDKVLCTWELHDEALRCRADAAWYEVPDTDLELWVSLPFPNDERRGMERMSTIGVACVTSLGR